MNKLQALKFVNLLELVNRQKMLDEKFKEKNKNNSSLNPRNKVNTLIALNTELGEIMQETKKYWNYWKVNCKFDKEHTLEEISDYLHFLLQFIYSEDSLYKDVVEKNSEFNAQFNKEIEQIEFIIKNEKNLNIENSLLFLALPLSNEILGYKLEIGDIYALFKAIAIILFHLESNWEEFLKIHHNKFELNYYERIKENY